MDEGLLRVECGMSIRHKQQRFTIALAKLIIYGDSIGCGFAVGDAYATTGHIKNSTHYHCLAIDLNMFVEDVYVEDSENHLWEKLHDYWEELGGSKMIPRDANHFSFKHNGVR